MSLGFRWIIWITLEMKSKILLWFNRLIKELKRCLVNRNNIKGRRRSNLLQGIKGIIMSKAILRRIGPKSTWETWIIPLNFQNPRHQQQKNWDSTKASYRLARSTSKITIDPDLSLNFGRIIWRKFWFRKLKTKSMKFFPSSLTMVVSCHTLN